MKHAHWAHMGLCVAVMLVAVLLPSYLASRKTSSLSNAPAPVLPEKLVAGKEKSVTSGAVTVIATPQLRTDGSTDTFTVTLTTHSVELSMDMVTSTLLLLPDGQTLTPLRWEGNPAGGHHRTGTLRFARQVVPQGNVVLVLSDGENEWRMVWD